MENKGFQDEEPDDIKPEKRDPEKDPETSTIKSPVLKHGDYTYELTTRTVSRIVYNSGKEVVTPPHGSRNQKNIENLKGQIHIQNNQIFTLKNKDQPASTQSANDGSSVEVIMKPSERSEAKNLTRSVSDNSKMKWYKKYEGTYSPLKAELEINEENRNKSKRFPIGDQNNLAPIRKALSIIPNGFSLMNDSEKTTDTSSVNQSSPEKYNFQRNKKVNYNKLSKFFTKRHQNIAKHSIGKLFEAKNYGRVVRYSPSIIKDTTEKIKKSVTFSDDAQKKLKLSKYKKFSDHSAQHEKVVENQNNVPNSVVTTCSSCSIGSNNSCSERCCDCGRKKEFPCWKCEDCLLIMKKIKPTGQRMEDSGNSVVVHSTPQNSTKAQDKSTAVTDLRKIIDSISTTKSDVVPQTDEITSDRGKIEGNGIKSLSTVKEMCTPLDKTVISRHDRICETLPLDARKIPSPMHSWELKSSNCKTNSLIQNRIMRQKLSSEQRSIHLNHDRKNSPMEGHKRIGLQMNQNISQVQWKKNIDSSRIAGIKQHFEERKFGSVGEFHSNMVNHPSVYTDNQYKSLPINFDDQFTSKKAVGTYEKKMYSSFSYGRIPRGDAFRSTYPINQIKEVDIRRGRLGLAGELPSSFLLRGYSSYRSHPRKLGHASFKEGSFQHNLESRDSIFDTNDISPKLTQGYTMILDQENVVFKSPFCNTRNPKMTTTNYPVRRHDRVLVSEMKHLSDKEDNSLIPSASTIKLMLHKDNLDLRTEILRKSMRKIFPELYDDHFSSNERRVPLESSNFLKQPTHLSSHYENSDYELANFRNSSLHHKYKSGSIQTAREYYDHSASFDRNSSKSARVRKLTTTEKSNVHDYENIPPNVTRYPTDAKGPNAGSLKRGQSERILLEPKHEIHGAGCRFASSYRHLMTAI